MAKYTSSIHVGWMIMGSIKEIIKQIAFMADVSVDIDISVGLFGRTATVYARGTDEQILKFEKLFNSIGASSIFDE